MDERRKASEVRTLWGKVWLALNNLLALAVIVGAHWLFGHLLHFAFPPALKSVIDVVDVIVSSFFALIYVYLGWEILAAFLPFLKRRAYGNASSATQQADE